MEFKVKSYTVLSAAITAAAQKNKQSNAFIMFPLCFFTLFHSPEQSGACFRLAHPLIPVAGLAYSVAIERGEEAGRKR
jgi:hypothetical protein